MLDEEGIRNFVQQISQLWIEPEIARRKEAGNLPDDFRILRCLIKLPQDQPPIVEFNDEISWVAKAKRGDGEPFIPGSDVFLHEIHTIESVDPPEVNGQRVAFVYSFWNGTEYQVCVDLSPNWPDNELPEGAKDWRFGELIASHLQALITEQSIYAYDNVQNELQKMGLWAAPALLPYPIAKIVKHLQDSDVQSAHATLVAYCTPAFIRGITDKWQNAAPFATRSKLIEEAIRAHELGYYHLSIYALLPQTEGIITDWEYMLNLATETIPFRTESKTKKFRDLIVSMNSATFTNRRITESTMMFILDGPVLQTFKQWLDETNLEFPNRHVTGHGKYDERLFTEENSVKVFLLLDTIYTLIAGNSEHSA